jgi:hypothetical protein
MNFDNIDNVDFLGAFGRSSRDDFSIDHRIAGHHSPQQVPYRFPSLKRSTCLARIYAAPSVSGVEENVYC